MARPAPLARVCCLVALRLAAGLPLARHATSLELSADDVEFSTVHQLPFGHVGSIDYAVWYWASTSVVKLRGGGLLVYSPGNASEIGPALRQLGEPKIVVVPNFWHVTYAADFCKAYPDAIYIASAAAMNNTHWTPHRVDYVLGAVPRPGGDGFTVEVPKPLRRLLRDFAVYQYPHNTQELVFYHRPSGSLVTCDVGCSLADYSNDDTRRWWLEHNATPPREPMYHTWIADDCPECRNAPNSTGCTATSNAYYLDLAEDCENWKVDPVSILGFNDFVSSRLALPGGVYSAHRAHCSEGEFRRAMVANSGYLRRYASMANTTRCKDVRPRMRGC